MHNLILNFQNSRNIFPLSVFSIISYVNVKQ